MGDCDWIIIGAIAGGLLTWFGQRSMQGVLKQQAAHLTRAFDVLELNTAGGGNSTLPRSSLTPPRANPQRFF